MLTVIAQDDGSILVTPAPGSVATTVVRAGQSVVTIEAKPWVQVTDEACRTRRRRRRRKDRD